MSNETTWNWEAKRNKRAFLALADGTIFRGYSVGAERDAVGEVVFNTGMSGYQEILSDPSYSGQFVTMTYPEIGNYGFNEEDMESRSLFANGFVIRELNTPSNWRSTMSLGEAFIKYNVPAIAGIDTRALTKLLRDKGTMKSYMAVENSSVPGKKMISEADAVAKAKAWEGLDGQDYAARVTCKEKYQWDQDGKLTISWGITDKLNVADIKIVAYDFGIKWNILRGLRKCGMDVTVVPAQTSAEKVLALKPDGVFLSNGPADPAAVTYAVEAAKGIIGKVPMMGICLGHQLLGLAMGGKTYRLKFGHHGCNHPVKDLTTSKIEITSQNHNYAVDINSLDQSKVEVTHVNLFDGSVEGLRHKTEPVFCVQYHPEAGPGPHDPFYLFNRFRDLIKNA